MSQDETRVAPLDDKKKNALMRYIFILFAVAFLLILLTFFMQLRDSNQTITELVQSNASALQNAEKLQEENRILAATVATLEDEHAAADAKHQEKIQEMDLLLTETEDMKDALVADTATMEELVKDTLRGYEALLVGENALESGDIDQAKAQLVVVEAYLQYLGVEGTARYQGLVAAIQLAETIPVLEEAPEE